MGNEVLYLDGLDTIKKFNNLVCKRLLIRLLSGTL